MTGRKQEGVVIQQGLQNEFLLGFGMLMCLGGGGPGLSNTVKWMLASQGQEICMMPQTRMLPK